MNALTGCRRINTRAMRTSIMNNPSADRPFIRTAVDPLPLVEAGDLSRFEADGGPEAPSPETVTVPPDHALGREPRWAASSVNQENIPPGS